MGIGGTSGKSTVTGMLGWILDRAGARPTVMNGAVMRNFPDEATPFASALVGDAATYVSEVDESASPVPPYRPDGAGVTHTQQRKSTDSGKSSARHIYLSCT